MKEIGLFKELMCRGDGEGIVCDSNSRLKRWPKLSAEKFAYSKERTSYATCVPCFFRLVAFRTSYAIRVACSFRLIALSKNELCFLCRVLVLTHRFKNELCYMCTVLVSTSGF